MSYQQQYGGSISQVNAQYAQPMGGGTVGESIAGSQRVVQNASHWWVQHPEDEPLPGCNIPSHYAVQCEALDGTPLPAPLCKLLRVPQGTKWGREGGMQTYAQAPVAAPQVPQAREEEC